MSHPAIPIGATRPCRVCGGEIVVTEKMQRAADYRCRACEVEQERAYTEANREKYQQARLARGRAGYWKTEARRDWNRRNKARNPEKIKARSVINNGLRSGRVQKKPCERCGTERSQAHHHDYSKPLEVRWLCARCHGLEHREAV